MNAPVDAGMLSRHDGPEGLAAEVSPPVAADLADVLDWLAAQFIRAPQREQVHAARSVVGQMLLREMGEVLGNETLMARLGQHLSEGTEEEVTVALQRRYTALFEGVFPRRCALPYASAWQGSGRLYDAPGGCRSFCRYWTWSLRRHVMSRLIIWLCSWRRWRRRCDRRVGRRFRRCWWRWTGWHRSAEPWHGWMVKGTTG